MEDPCCGCELLPKRNLFLSQQENSGRHAHHESIASLDRFKRLCDATFEGIVIHENGIYIESNQQFADMFGYALEEIKGLNGFNLFAPDSRQFVGEKIGSGYEGIYQAIALKKDGTPFPVEVRAKESYLNGRKVRIAVCRDLTMQKAMERGILESEKRYRELYDYTRIPLYRACISNGELIECNHAMANLLGYESKEECLLKYHSASHYADPARRAELLRRLKKEGSVTKFEIEFIRCSGAHGWVEVTAKFYPEQGYIEGVQFDITADKVLSNTEKGVLRLIMQGHGNKQVAKLTNRSVRTVEDHRSRIMQKLGVSNLVELVKVGQFLMSESER